MTTYFEKNRLEMAMVFASATVYLINSFVILLIGDLPGFYQITGTNDVVMLFQLGMVFALACVAASLQFKKSWVKTILSIVYSIPVTGTSLLTMVILLQLQKHYHDVAVSILLAVVFSMLVMGITVMYKSIHDRYPKTK